MPDDDRTLDAERGGGGNEDRRLLGRPPWLPFRPLAITRSRPVEDDDAVALGEAVDDAADDEILEHRTIAVDQHDWRPHRPHRVRRTAFEIMNPDAFHIDEAPERRMGLLGGAGPCGVDQRGGGKRGDTGGNHRNRARTRRGRSDSTSLHDFSSGDVFVSNMLHCGVVPCYSAAMLTINAVTVRLGGRVILDRASAAIPPRARVGLIGRNGAGKSTLMKLIARANDPDEGGIDMPKGARIGYVAQETPAGSATPFETVLAADIERNALLAEEESLVGSLADAHRIGEIHERLNAIDAHTAPARASRILVGLGFDEAAQHRPLDSYSGGWRMRVALAALLFSQPDLLLLDEPSNHLDLEATLWLENFLKSYRATMVVISHERDLLNNVVDYILHLEGGQTTLYAGGYDDFERQRNERLAQLASAREAQATQRAKLTDYIARNSARASTAKQAQSRMKALARMQPIAEAANDPSLVFDFPSPVVLKPPLVQLDHAAVGYNGTPILEQIELRLDPDDRLALLGRNGNGKTTLARLLAGQLPAMDGHIGMSTKLKVGYFTQYQVEELDSDDTPLAHMARLMPGAKPTAVRGQLGRFGFSGLMAEQKVGKMSGGEKARLALALITRDAPHLLILDEPTNHLDVDAREALVQALAEYGGAVVVVSHDRHMLEATADRLVLVEDGHAVEFSGSLDDYTDRVLGRGDARPEKRVDKNAAAKPDKKAARQESAGDRAKTVVMRRTAREAEADIARLSARLAQLDTALSDPAKATGADRLAGVPALLKTRATVDKALSEAEAKWMTASEALEAAA